MLIWREDVIPDNSALKGIRVLDFTWAGAGPLSTQVLANYGAQVIKVESRKRLDIARISPPFAHNTRHVDGAGLFVQANTSKLGVSLNLQHGKAIEIVKKLVEISDVVVENFTPGVMERLGLAYKDLKKIKPDIIAASSSIYGQNGPKSRFSGFGNTGYGIAGHYMMTGWPDREPVAPSFVYPDVAQPYFTAIAILAALDYRRKTGMGQYIDSTMVETMTQFIAPTMVDYFVNGKTASRNGNRTPEACPHGAFPCKGDDQWCAIAVFEEVEWKDLCKAMGNPQWCQDDKFSSVTSRKANEDELETLISQWTITYDRYALMALLQEAGVTAGALQDADDLIDVDPQLRERQSFVRLTHPVIGECNHPAPAMKLSESPACVKTSPCLGQHNEYIYKELLGIDDEAYDTLLKEGVFE